MRNTSNLLIGISLCWGAITMQAQASEAWAIGQVLSAAEISALGPLPSVHVGSKSLRILPRSTTNAQGLPVTWVLDQRGRIGQTLHEVTVPALPTEHIKALSPVLENAASVKYYEELPMTLLRYASLQEAATAVELIQTAIPDAKASVQIQYSVLKPQ